MALTIIAHCSLPRARFEELSFAYFYHSAAPVEKCMHDCDSHNINGDTRLCGEDFGNRTIGLCMHGFKRTIVVGACRGTSARFVVQ